MAEAVAQTKGPVLPLILTASNKATVGIVAFVIAMGMYLTTNHFFLFSPKLLPLTWVDQRVPFVPGTIWVYNSEWLLLLTLYAKAKDIDNLNKFLYSIFTLVAASCLVFLFWPTIYPRELFPLPAGLDPLTSGLFELLRRTDTPANCCPSLHVSAVYLSAFLFLDEKEGLFPLFFAWATAISLSTLTTKQHYVADVVSGLALAVLFYWFFHRKVRYAAPAR